MLQDPSANLCQSVFEFGRGLLRSKTSAPVDQAVHLKKLEGRIRQGFQGVKMADFWGFFKDSRIAPHESEIEITKTPIKRPF